MAGTVGTFKSDHHVIFGLALITAGVFGVIGSLTGQLAVMLAALFDPAALSVASGSNTTAPPVVGATPPDEPTTPTTPESPALPGSPELGAGGTADLGSGGLGIGELLTELGSL